MAHWFGIEIRWPTHWRNLCGYLWERLLTPGSSPDDLKVSIILSRRTYLWETASPATDCKSQPFSHSDDVAGKKWNWKAEWKISRPRGYYTQEFGVIHRLIYLHNNLNNPEKQKPTSCPEQIVIRKLNFGCSPWMDIVCRARWIASIPWPPCSGTRTARSGEDGTAAWSSPSMASRLWSGTRAIPWVWRTTI